jgi:ferric-dicitrate binding protein FerR (iron transport regulator)
MNAEDAEALLSAAYDAELPTDERREFERVLHANPELAQRYREFCLTIQTLKLAEESVPAPDLLAGVQRRLRMKSGGRFYRDRFAERAGGGGRQQLFILLWTSALVLVTLWAVFAYFGDAQVLR